MGMTPQQRVCCLCGGIGACPNMALINACRSQSESVHSQLFKKLEAHLNVINFTGQDLISAWLLPGHLIPIMCLCEVQVWFRWCFIDTLADDKTVIQWNSLKIAFKKTCVDCKWECEGFQGINWFTFERFFLYANELFIKSVGMDTVPEKEVPERSESCSTC